MSDFQINDHILSKECDELAAEIAAEFNAGELEASRDEMMDRAHEMADGHEWVIYNHKALMLCAHCDTGMGDEFLDDTGFEWVQGESTIYTVATTIAYGEMLGRIRVALEELIEADEEAAA